MQNPMQIIIRKNINPKRAQSYQRYFKTGPGEYGEGDVFLGISNPKCRQIAKEFKFIQLTEVEQLLHSQYHEKRSIALMIMIEKFKKEKESVFHLYFKNLKWINNWDLVDLSAPSIVGSYLMNSKNNTQDVLFCLSQSSSVWDRRISIVSTLAFIRSNCFEQCFRISLLLLEDSHDLIQKGVGWMLKEVSKRNEEKIEIFLKENHKKMHRTTFRYAIQKFDEEKRKRFLKGDF